MGANPTGQLKRRIWEMNTGVYKSDSEAPQELKDMIAKYQLDGDATWKLTGFINKSPEELQQQRISEIEKRLATSTNCNATALQLMVKLAKGEPLPPPYPAREKPRSRSRGKDKEARSPVRQRYRS